MGKKWNKIKKHKKKIGYLILVLIIVVGGIYVFGGIDLDVTHSETADEGDRLFELEISNEGYGRITETEIYLAVMEYDTDRIDYDRRITDDTKIEDIIEYTDISEYTGAVYPEYELVKIDGPSVFPFLSSNESIRIEDKTGQFEEFYIGEIIIISEGVFGEDKYNEGETHIKWD